MRHHTWIFRLFLVISAITPAYAQDLARMADSAAALAEPIDIEDIDRRIEHVVKEAYYSDPTTRANRIEVAVDDRIVTLKGAVKTLAVKERAYRIAAFIPEVADVVNRIAVFPVDMTPLELREAVAAALRLNPSTEALQIRLHADEAGRITLRGTVDSWAERILAGAAAKTVPGVVSVRNLLDVSAMARHRHDEEIAADVQRLLRWDGSLEDANIEVTVTSGAVNLSGTVTSQRDRRRAVTWAWQSGADDVRTDGLRIAEKRTSPLPR